MSYETFSMDCPRCRRHLKVAVGYHPQALAPYLARDLGGHHPACASKSLSSGLGYSAAQSLFVLNLRLTPTC